MRGGSHDHRLRGATRATSRFVQCVHRRRETEMSSRTGAVRRHPTAVAALASVILVTGIGWIASSSVASASSNAVIEWNAVAGQAARCLSVAGQRPVARGPDVRDRAHRGPRCGERHRPSVRAVCLRRARSGRDISRRRGSRRLPTRHWSQCCRTCHRSCSRRRAVQLESRPSTPPTRPHWGQSRTALPSRRAWQWVRRPRRRSWRCAATIMPTTHRSPTPRTRRERRRVSTSSRRARRSHSRPSGVR